MPQIHENQPVAFALDPPQQSDLPIQVFANCPQDVLRTFNHIIRFSKNSGYGVLQGQALLRPLALSDVEREAAGMNKLTVFAVDAGINANVSNSAVLAEHAGLVIMNCFTALQAGKDVVNYRPVSMEF